MANPTDMSMKMLSTCQTWKSHVRSLEILLIIMMLPIGNKHILVY